MWSTDAMTARRGSERPVPVRVGVEGDLCVEAAVPAERLRPFRRDERGLDVRAVSAAAASISGAIGPMASTGSTPAQSTADSVAASSSPQVGR